MRPFSGKSGITLKDDLLPYAPAESEAVDGRLFKILLEKI
jgi:hypothetical protein